MMLRAAYGVAGGMVLALAAAAPAAASTNGAASAHNKVRTFASCRAQGDFAVCCGRREREPAGAAPGARLRQP